MFICQKQRFYVFYFRIQTQAALSLTVHLFRTERSLPLQSQLLPYPDQEPQDLDTHHVSGYPGTCIHKRKETEIREIPRIKIIYGQDQRFILYVNMSQKTSEISGIRTHAFSVKGKQPRQHGMVGLALLPTRPARLLMEAAIMGILNFVVNTQQLMQRKVLMVLLYIIE